MVKACVTSFDTTPFLCKIPFCFAVSDLILDPLDRGDGQKRSDELWGYPLVI